ncbi:hypothetical protein CDAR_119231 [Caerostris darwini]|uniref:Uncharacterized protein n=1 Tax=Caerostris darwini TaxID=1538125 RepID=A0AAV4RR31_9ARAC|nr:hypothetical protein CDAR_119231 [Caerostris darwini]
MNIFFLSSQHPLRKSWNVISEPFASNEVVKCCQRKAILAAHFTGVPMHNFESSRPNCRRFHPPPTPTLGCLNAGQKKKKELSPPSLLRPTRVFWKSELNFLPLF